MPKWTPDEHGCIYDEAGCFARLTPNKAERLATRHNADIDALTAERDAVITKLLDLYKPGSAPEQHYKTWDDYQREYREWEADCELYRLACEAAKKDPEQ